VSDLRVLVVEDEAAIAMLIEDMLLDFDCTVVSIESKLSKAIEKAKDIDVDVAILDVNLAGETSYPVADILKDRGIHIIFSTGYGTSGLRADFADTPVLQKPFVQKDLLNKLQQLID